MLYRPFLFRRLLPEPLYLRIYNWRWRSHWRGQDHYLKLLKSASADNRFFGASALSGYDSPFDVPMELLMATMENDTEPAVRRVCVSSLPAVPEVLSVWHRMLKTDVDSDVRWRIMVQLRGLPFDEAFPMYLEALADHEAYNAEIAFGDLEARTRARVPAELRPKESPFTEEEVARLRRFFAEAKQ